MGAWSDRIESRLREVENGRVSTVPAFSRRGDQRVQRVAENSAVHTVTVRLGTLNYYNPVLYYRAFTWSSSYLAGGESLSDAAAGVGTLLSVTVAPKAGYTFAYNSGTGNIRAYTTAGSEVPDTTDLLALVGTVDVTILGTGPTAHILYVSEGGERVESATIMVQDTVAKDGTDYWTLKLQRRNRTYTRGEQVGTTTLTNSTRGFLANETLELYSSDVGLDLALDDYLVLSAVASTAVTEKLQDAVVTLRLRRRIS